MRAQPDVKKKVLFVCIHNSARSQMAEAFLNHLCGETFEAHSAGLEPGNLNPIVVEVMCEIGLDIAGNKTKAVSEALGSAVAFSHVITVCDEASAERCPVFPGGGTRIHWGFPDPSTFRGSPDAVLVQTREVRDAIKEKIQQWCDEMCAKDKCQRPIDRSNLRTIGGRSA